MGVHSGSVERVGNNYVGLELHHAARVAAAAHGGQVLLSSAARGLLHDGTRAEVEDLGEFQLRDFDEPEQLFQVVIPGLQSSFPPPRTASARVVAIRASQVR